MEILHLCLKFGQVNPGLLGLGIASAMVLILDAALYLVCWMIQARQSALGEPQTSAWSVSVSDVSQGQLIHVKLRNCVDAWTHLAAGEADLRAGVIGGHAIKRQNLSRNDCTGRFHVLTLESQNTSKIDPCLQAC